MTPRIQTASGDEAARERIRQSLHESLIVEASAGTGKTTELVNRIVQVLGHGLTTIEKIVAVTFTHKAAGELKIRLRQALDEARRRAREQGDEEVADRLETALEELEEASIGTIHGFCAQILRSRPVEARIDPAFCELTEPEAARIYERAFSAWFQRQLDQESPGLRRALARLAWREDWESGPAIDQLKFAGRKLIEWRDFPSEWELEPFDRDAAVDQLLKAARSLWTSACTCTRGSDALVTSLRPVRDVLAWIDRGQVKDPDTLEAVLLKLGRDLKHRGRFKKGSGFFSKEVTRESLFAAYESFQAALNQFRLDSGVLLAAQLQREMRSLVEEYGRIKSRTGQLDFVDLLLLARNLVRDDENVRRYLQQRFTHIFVDEFQDTDPLQAAILLLLSADDPSETDWLRTAPVPGKLFLVGDPKQSIYKFRRADVSLYSKIAAQLEGRGVGRVYLTQSYRSLRPIQQFVNAAFAPEMAGNADGSQAEYSPLEENGSEIDGQPAIVALPAPVPYGDTRIAKYAIDACLPGTVAAYVHWLVNESGWRVREAGELVALREKHICILFRRFINFGTDLTREYVRALEARGVPHLLVGSKSFHNREEVETVRTALTAIEWPEDELSVYATLRGSLFAIADDVLFRFRYRYQKLHPFRKYPAEASDTNEFRAIVEALAVLAELHRWRNERPVPTTVRALLNAARAHAGFAMRPGGQQVLANVYRIGDLARQYELTGGLSFRGFVEELNAQAERAEAPEAPVLEEAADGVRLMTVHNAKGLEFPVVILADITANLSSKEPDRFVDAERQLCAMRLLRCAPRELLDNEGLEESREQAEGVRVCYVAATRARDLLVIPAVGEEEREGWLSPLNRAIYPRKERWRFAEPCGWFRGDRTVLSRPYYSDDMDPSVMPGWHRAQAGSHKVLWWDPATLNLDVSERFGLSNVNLLKAEAASAENLHEYQNWREQRAETIAHGSAPSIAVVRVTDLQEEAPGANVDLAIAGRSGKRKGASARVRGARFGTLVHAVLRDLAWDADDDEIARLAALYRIAGGATDAEEAAAIDAVRAAIAHPVLRRAAQSERCHRELPVTLPLPGNRVLEGVIDLAFVENGRWQVVDYKTDADTESNRELYSSQLRWYLHALATLTGMEAEGTLLAV